MKGPAQSAIYDQIGSGYAGNRTTDARWEAQVHAALRNANNIVNIGAGSGSYEPRDVAVIAVEPSSTMIRQRPVGSAPVVQAVAEQLPLPDNAFDVALAVLTTHHWRDPMQGLQEMRRVARKQVIVTWSPDIFAENFWLVRDYLPQVHEHESKLATLDTVVQALGRTLVQPLLVPADCTDGFFGAYWQQPSLYLDAAVRASMSGLALLEDSVVDAAMARLEKDLQSGAWLRANRELLDRSTVDLGYRLVETVTSTSGEFT